MLKRVEFKRLLPDAFSSKTEWKQHQQFGILIAVLLYILLGALIAAPFIVWRFLF